MADQVLESFPADKDGLSKARKAQRRHAESLTRKGLGKKYGVDVIQRGGSYWVTLVKR
ncbi:hypothetical protein ACIQVO_35940 [Streptomyces sp. NPDC101062]|uniref:hypothetical protein n=1 Tax=unclassified Streptomyces TaxID=2593676 RepID=UPI00382ADE5B